MQRIEKAPEAQQVAFEGTVWMYKQKALHRLLGDRWKKKKDIMHIVTEYSRAEVSAHRIVIIM